MEYARFGATGMKVSRICLGTMSYGGPNERWPCALDEETSRPFIKRELELGINFFDTANVYSNGRSEEIVGKALRDFAARDEVVIATKVYFEMGPGPNEGGLWRKHILSAIDASLKRLGIDYIDLYQIHRWDYSDYRMRCTCGAQTPASPFGTSRIFVHKRRRQSMQTRKLGRTGLDVSPIAIGGAAFSYVQHSMGWDPMSEAGRNVVYATLNTALDRGITYIDTAPAYGNGYSETLIGEVMKTRRKDCVLASKVWYELDHQGVIDSVHASLNRLQTDHIDILQVHGRMYSPTEVEHVLHGGPLDALLELREAGTIGHIGITSEEPWTVIPFLAPRRLRSIRSPTTSSIRLQLDISSSRRVRRMRVW
jgi:aryl-alcohol dehydrogenase-like predicted oxidoreductase